MNPVLCTYSVHTYLSSTYSVRPGGKQYVPVCTLHKKYVLKRSGTRRYNTIAWYEVVRTGSYQVRTTVQTSGILYPLYKVVQDGMYWYEPVRTLVDTRPYKKPPIGTRQYVLPYVIPRSVRTGMYWHVLTCTNWYKVVQGDTRWYEKRYKKVQEGTRRYKN
jgi:hypothetical protein